MSARYLTQTISPSGGKAQTLKSSRDVRQVRAALLALLILVIVWLAAAELLVFLFKDSWSFALRYS